MTSMNGGVCIYEILHTLGKTLTYCYEIPRMLFKGDLGNKVNQISEQSAKHKMDTPKNPFFFFFFAIYSNIHI